MRAAVPYVVSAVVASYAARVNGAGQEHGEGLVLVADDEAGVRSVARRVLERAGFRVCVAVDGREAVEVFAAQRDQIRAVLLDMSMPRLCGDEVLSALRELVPDVRVVLTSGFDPAGELEGVTFLAKPWTPQELLAALREALA